MITAKAEFDRISKRRAADNFYTRSITESHLQKAATNFRIPADFHNAVRAGVDEIAHVPMIGQTPIAVEDARLAAELQITALEAVHDSHAAALRWQPAWTDALTDPLRLYQRGLAETFESTQRAFALMGTSARLVVQAADRLQTATTETGRRIRETLYSSPGMRETRR